MSFETTHFVHTADGTVLGPFKTTSEGLRALEAHNAATQPDLGAPRQAEGFGGHAVDLKPEVEALRDDHLCMVKGCDRVWDVVYHRRHQDDTLTLCYDHSEELP